MSRYGEKVNKLISEIKNGKNGAYKCLFDLTYNHLKTVAYYYLIDKNECEDVVTEAYLHVFKYIDSFNADKDGYNWLCRIVQNIAYTYNRKTVLCESIDKADKAEVSFEDALVIKSDLWNEMSKLSENERELVYMKFWEDMSYAEIARNKNLKKSYVHKKVSGLIKQILKNLQKNSDD